MNDIQDDAALEKERKRRQNRRSIAIALSLVALVAVFYIVTIIRLGGNVMNRVI